MRTLRRLGRALIRALALLVFPTRAAPSPPARPRSILVVRTDDRIGNVLLTTPLVAELRRAFPEARIAWLVAARRVALVQGWTAVDQLVPFDRRKPWRLFGLVRTLRRLRPEVALEASHWHAASLTSALLARISGAPVRIGFDKMEVRRLLTHAVPLPPPDEYDATAKLALLAPLGLRATGFTLHTTLDTDAGPLLSAAGLRPGAFIAINVGGRKADHRLDAGSWRALLAALGTDPPVFLLWGPGERDLAAAIAQASPNARIAPPTDMAQLAALFRAARAVVATDTGPMHLAVATGTPTVGIFTRPDWRRWASPAPTFHAVSTEAPDWPAQAARAIRAIRGHTLGTHTL